MWKGLTPSGIEVKVYKEPNISNEVYFQFRLEVFYESYDRVMYIYPFDGKFKDFPDGARASVDHILPQSAFNKIDGFDKLPKHVQNELINHPMNLQPLPKELNSSKGAKIETGTEGWQRYVKENKDISPLYRKYLADRQDEIRAEVLVAIEKFGVNK
ncbi:Uncharacterised protein [Haemophilus pittmaniae]|uniref:GmrSD restriction endonucleases C-terminal domain-containing protein n=1 Tax=Haemophilus pittmaniae TaxID=249188 RepID=A0A377J0S8_9PAST|nr:DUF1524 domain-containing protein [Haemophilus pittmaniae]STO94105.1 Uncharacterised protein [Haemophilus pittmaniae]